MAAGVDSVLHRHKLVYVWETLGREDNRQRVRSRAVPAVCQIKEINKESLSFPTPPVLTISHYT